MRGTDASSLGCDASVCSKSPPARQPRRQRLYVRLRRNLDFASQRPRLREGASRV